MKQKIEKPSKKPPILSRLGQWPKIVLALVLVPVVTDKVVLLLKEHSLHNEFIASWVPTDDLNYYLKHTDQMYAAALTHLTPQQRYELLLIEYSRLRELEAEQSSFSALPDLCHSLKKWHFEGTFQAIDEIAEMRVYKKYGKKELRQLQSLLGQAAKEISEEEKMDIDQRLSLYSLKAEESWEYYLPPWYHVFILWLEERT